MGSTRVSSNLTGVVQNFETAQKLYKFFFGTLANSAAIAKNANFVQMADTHWQLSELITESEDERVHSSIW